MTRSQLASLLDRLEVPSAPSEAWPALREDIADHVGALDEAMAEVMTELLSRTLHGGELRIPPSPAQKYGDVIHCFANAGLIAEMSWEDCDDPDVAKLVAFASNGGSEVVAVDPTNHFGRGPAVYIVDRTAADTELLALAAPTLEAYLCAFVDGVPLARPRTLRDLRADEVAAAAGKPLRLADGTLLPADAIESASFDVRADHVRGVRLARPLELRGHRYRAAAREAWQDARRAVDDLTFHANGAVEAGCVDAISVGDWTLAPGSAVRWSDTGRLVAFTPMTEIVVRGVRCAAGAPIACARRMFAFTPVDDIDYGGQPCKAGAAVEHYLGIGLHFTASVSRGALIAGERATVRLLLATYDESQTRDLRIELAGVVHEVGVGALRGQD